MLRVARGPNYDEDAPRIIDLDQITPVSHLRYALAFSEQPGLTKMYSKDNMDDLAAQMQHPTLRGRLVGIFLAAEFLQEEKQWGLFDSLTELANFDHIILSAGNISGAFEYLPEKRGIDNIKWQIKRLEKNSLIHVAYDLRIALAIRDDRIPDPPTTTTTSTTSEPTTSGTGSTNSTSPASTTELTTTGTPPSTFENANATTTPPINTTIPRFTSNFTFPDLLDGGIRVEVGLKGMVGLVGIVLLW